MTDKDNDFLDWLEQLQEPTDYFNGLQAPDPIIPQKLMFFMRNDRRWLDRASAIKQHHHRHVLIIVLETPGSIIINGREFYLNPVSAFLMHPHQIHTYKNIDTWNMRWIYITFELPDGQNLEEIWNISIPLDSPALEFLDSALRLYVNKDLKGGFEPTELTLKVSLFINRILALNHRKTETVTGDRKGGKDDLLDQINHYIVHHMREGINIDALAKSANFSPGHLRKTFRQQYGLSIGAYIHDKKVQRAQSLLMQTNLSIKEIAFDCGFKQLPSFTRFFRQAKGDSPKDYRLKHGPAT